MSNFWPYGSHPLSFTFFRDGRLQEGDQILAIDGQPLDSNISHQQAISILQQARGLVELVVARGGIAAPDHQGTTTATAAVSLERSPSAVSDTSKGSDMVVSNRNLYSVIPASNSEECAAMNYNELLLVYSKSFLRREETLFRTNRFIRYGSRAID